MRVAEEYIIKMKYDSLMQVLEAYRKYNVDELEQNLLKAQIDVVEELAQKLKVKLWWYYLL